MGPPQVWRECVLYVGDCRNNRDAIRRAFDNHGLPLVAACCYREALSWINRTKFALVLCEERLRDGRWLDLVSRFAEMSEPPALIVLAETQDAANWAEAINLGARDVLVTPIDDSDLQHLVDRVAVPA